MFNNSPYTTISRGTFNIVHGNQYNTYYSGEDMGASQFLPGEEWKVELYREVRQISNAILSLFTKSGSYL
ncbi:hypothetical protein L218DRAFT_968410, partial [Marasmius fiardii PR-910]